MTSTRLIVMTTLTLCFIVGLQASPGSGCFCIRTTSAPIPVRVISRIEVIPASGHCRQIEIIVTRKNGSKVCADPNGKWGKFVIRILLKK
ncbi:interleukin-8 [Labrus bergylta]|uniref:interleukin-8 n=1 Tax=Labrus bergylta TaxID=56723 RepID=UPI0009B42376|nr:interleukin-8-like [Labrus bergylta]